MSLKQWLAIAGMGTLSIAAMAQEKQAQQDPSDANAPAAAIGYASAFEGYRSSADEADMPDKNWRALNDEVGRLGGHAGHMKDSRAQPDLPDDQDDTASSGTDHAKHH